MPPGVTERVAAFAGADTVCVTPSDQVTCHGAVPLSVAVKDALSGGLIEELQQTLTPGAGATETVLFAVADPQARETVTPMVVVPDAGAV